MKKVLIHTIVAFTFIAVSCNEEKKTENTEVTTEQNEMKQDSTKAANDGAFAVAVADGGMLEIKLGQLAQTNGSSAKVKEMGKMMETDHSKASDELIVWAMKHSVSLPTELSAEKKQQYDEFAAKKGADFDKTYAAFMVEDHEKDIAAFKKQADEGSDTELKSWAAGKLPLLEHHLEMAKATNNAVKK